MNRLDEAIKIIKEELTAIEASYEVLGRLQADNKIEQDKIIQQNLTLKHLRDELTKSQAEVKAKENDLNIREKQILLREKTQLNSTRMLDEKLEEFRERTHTLAQEEAKLKKDKEEYEIKKSQIEKNVLINKDIELKLQKIKLKETQVDNELNRLKNMSL